MFVYVSIYFHSEIPPLNHAGSHRPNKIQRVMPLPFQRHGNALATSLCEATTTLHPFLLSSQIINQRKVLLCCRERVSWVKRERAKTESLGSDFVISWGRIFS